MGKTAFEEVFLANPAKDGNKLANHFPVHGPANIAINSKKRPKKHQMLRILIFIAVTAAPRSLTSITCEGERLS